MANRCETCWFWDRQMVKFIGNGVCTELMKGMQKKSEPLIVVTKDMDSFIATKSDFCCSLYKKRPSHAKVGRAYTG